MNKLSYNYTMLIQIEESFLSGQLCPTGLYIEISKIDDIKENQIKKEYTRILEKASPKTLMIASKLKHIYPTAIDVTPELNRSVKKKLRDIFVEREVNDRKKVFAKMRHNDKYNWKNIK